MILSLLKEGVIERPMNAQVAGTNDTLSSSIQDMSGYRAIQAIALLGDVTNTSVITLKAFVGDQPALGDGAYETVTATFTAGAADADNNVLVLDLINPVKRYVRFDLVRSTANAVVDGIVTIKYNAKSVPVTQSADVIDSDIVIE